MATVEFDLETNSDKVTARWTVVDAERTCHHLNQKSTWFPHEMRESDHPYSWAWSLHLLDHFDLSEMSLTVTWLHPLSPKAYRPGVTPGWHAKIYRDNNDDVGVSLPVVLL